MSNNLILFYLYLLIILLFLSILSYLISIELFYIIFFSRINYNLSQIDNEAFIYFVNLYNKRKEWFLFISMLEFCLNKKIFNIITIYNNLGYCYNNLSYLQLAEYYYSNALLVDKNNIFTLQNLSQLYKKNNDDNKLIQINKIINLVKTKN